MTTDTDVRQTDAPLPELMIGETATWRVGICTIKASRDDGRRVSLHNNPDKLTVYGENQHVIGTIDLRSHDIDEVDEWLHETIAAEHAEM